jgi:hypothetical protein
MKTDRDKDDTVPRALREVWEWKDAVWREVEHLPTREAVHEILIRARKTAEELGFAASGTGSALSSRAVAEGRERYGTRNGARSTTEEKKQ